jgi:hypothetical protein
MTDRTRGHTPEAQERQREPEAAHDDHRPERPSHEQPEPADGIGDPGPVSKPGIEAFERKQIDAVGGEQVGLDHRSGTLDPSNTPSMTLAHRNELPVHIDHDARVDGAATLRKTQPAHQTDPLWVAELRASTLRVLDDRPPQSHFTHDTGMPACRPRPRQTFG